MAFSFKNPWRGGALGKLANAIVVVQNAISAIAGGHRIKVSGDPSRGLTISYVGTEPFGDGWSGKIIDPATGAAVVDIDVTKPSNLQGKYICYNTDTGSSEWDNSPKNTEGWLSYHVCDTLTATQYGNYALSSACSGNIVLPGTGTSIPTTDKFDVMTVVDNGAPPPALKWAGKPFAVKLDPSVGFAFSKPTGEEFHTQMKASGGSAGQYLRAAAGDGAEWDAFGMETDVKSASDTQFDMEFTPPTGSGDGTMTLKVPDVTVITRIASMDLEMHFDAGLWLRITPHVSTFNLSTGTVVDDVELGPFDSNSIPTADCP